MNEIRHSKDNMGLLEQPSLDDDTVVHDTIQSDSIVEFNVSPKLRIKRRQVKAANKSEMFSPRNPFRSPTNETPL